MEIGAYLLARRLSSDGYNISWGLWDNGVWKADRRLHYVPNMAFIALLPVYLPIVLVTGVLGILRMSISDNTPCRVTRKSKLDFPIVIFNADQISP